MAFIFGTTWKSLALRKWWHCTLSSQNGSYIKNAVAQLSSLNYKIFCMLQICKNMCHSVGIASALTMSRFSFSFYSALSLHLSSKRIIRILNSTKKETKKIVFIVACNACPHIRLFMHNLNESFHTISMYPRSICVRRGCLRRCPFFCCCSVTHNVHPLSVVHFRKINLHSLISNNNIHLHHWCLCCLSIRLKLTLPPSRKHTDTHNIK